MTANHRSSPVFRAEHVGSLLRPAELRQAYRAHGEGTLTADAFREVQDKCVREAVAMQEDIGFEAVTDGEFRRGSYWSHFVDGIEGLGLAPALFEFHDEAGEPTRFQAPCATAKLTRAHSLSGDEFDFLKSVTTKMPKVTMPTAPTMHFWSDPRFVREAGYPDEDAFFGDLARVYREEIADLGGRGATYLQMDEVPLVMLCDAGVRDGLKARGEDPERLTDRYVDLNNASLAGRPPAMTVAMHLCRGNFKGKWLSEGSYLHVAERLFNDIDVDAYFLEYDTPRAGDFEPLRYVPDGKFVVLGLVSSKAPELEPAEDLRRRIDEASRFVPLERLAISPQCGFASAVSGNPVTYEDQVNKLRLVADVAARVWN